jgi:threonine/homoserine/homoserine lactone efflux protein
VFLTSLLAFTGIALVVVLMPGADTVLVLRTSLRYGARAGIITATGIVCGPIIWGALAGLGVALILGQNPLLYNIVATAGGLYLIYLAAQSFRAATTGWLSPNDEHLPRSGTTLTRSSVATQFTTGLMTNLLNPKIGVFYISVMPGLFIGQHIGVGLGALLGLIQAVLGLMFLTAVALLSARANGILTRPRIAAAVELACGLCLFLFGTYVFVEVIARTMAI